MADNSLKNPPLPASREKPVLKIENLAFAYSGKPVLQDVNLEIHTNEAVGVSGKNGSGKTTLFRCLTGLEKWQKGRLEFLGEEIAAERDFQRLRRETGYVLQNPDNQIVFPTVLEDVMFGPLNLGFGHDRAEESAFYWLGKIGLSGFENRLTSRLSGGEKRLVSLAGILVMKPRLLLLDEPLNELDDAACERVIQILSDLECACIIASHDARLFQKTVSKVLFLENGRLTEKTTE